MRVGVYGLGEAGGLIAAGLAEAGMMVCAYDPAAVATPIGVVRYQTPEQAVVDANLVIALTAAADAMKALNQAFDMIPAGAIYADFSTAPAYLKSDLCSRALQRKIAFVDVALLAVVPGNGIRTTALASGPGADRFVEIFKSLGMPIESLGEEPGDAATRKLLRSVFMKGLAGVMIEALQAADRVNLSSWLWSNLTSEIAKADESLVHRLVSGTGSHAERRLHEMEASAQLLQDLGVEPVMTRGTIENLQQVLEHGLPPIPAAAS
jgi:3-hydroxyisobutyrate dehydrogenase-like beta-hydroxyacid dehydrogenase